MGNETGNNNTSGLQEEDNTAQDESEQEVAQADDLKGQNHLVPVTQDKDSHQKETGLVSGDVVREDSNGDGQKTDNKEEDNMKTEGKKSLQDAARTDDDKRRNQVPSSKDIYKNEKERGFEHDVLASPDAENQKHDEKDEDTIRNPEAEEIPLEEASSTDETNAEAHLVPAIADKITQGIETGLDSSDRDGMTYPHVDKQKQDEKEEDINIIDEAKEKSVEEAARKHAVEVQDQVLPPVEDKNTHGNETGLVSSDPEGTADPHGDNPKQDEKEDDNTKAEPQEKPLAEDDNADNIEEKGLTIPAAESTKVTIPAAESTKVEAKPSEAVGDVKEPQAASSSKNLEDHEMQQESNFEENLSGTSHHLKNQNSMMKENDGTQNSISDSASSNSHDSVPQELAVLEPEEHELAKMQTEQLVQVCNGPLKSDDRIIPSLTCQDQENGFTSDSSISTDTVESASPDPSLEIGKERDDFSVLEMATKVSSEEKFEPDDGDEAGNHLGNKATITTDLPNGVGAKCNRVLPSEMYSIKSDSPESQAEAILSHETQNFLQEVSKTEDRGIVLSQEATLVREESENEYSKHSHDKIQSGQESIQKSNGQRSEEGSKTDQPNASPPQFMMNDHQNEEKRCMLDTSCDSTSYDKDSQPEEAKIVENGHLVDASINYQNEATEEQQKDTHLVTEPAVFSAETFIIDQEYKEEESKEKKIIKEKEDSNPIENDASRRENGEQCISGSYPKEKAEAFPSPSPFLHALPEKQQQDSHLECKEVQNSSESVAELKQETSGEFSTNEASSFVAKNLTQKNVVSVVEFAGEKCSKPTPETIPESQPSAKMSSEQCAIGETRAIANGDYYQRGSVGRLSTESNPDNMSIHAQMRKSPSFNLDLHIDARAEESDQTPLLYQDKTTIESFSSQAYVTDPGKPVANTEYGKNSLQYEAMSVEEKVVTLERSDSEKSKTPFLGFLKEEEADHMLITPKKQENQSDAKKATKVSAKEVTSASTKGKDKRKPRTSLFGTCMCCATVIN
ncbi:hypothetical protein REPUB_Repub20aG0090200 [Reevesia pubescens]